ncbi:MAG: hypothetical protein K0Q79_924 [Flavipsychrobacter sp.]|nr:hypothetical protein [Flavipsychrobacter sp.]
MHETPNASKTSPCLPFAFAHDPRGKGEYGINFNQLPHNHNQIFVSGVLLPALYERERAFSTMAISITISNVTNTVIGVPIAVAFAIAAETLYNIAASPRIIIATIATIDGVRNASLSFLLSSSLLLFCWSSMWQLLYLKLANILLTHSSASGLQL